MNTRACRPDSVPVPSLRMTPITAERYISAEYFQREWKRMWMRTWQIGGMAYQAPEPGDYLVCDLGPESILIVRQDDNSFKAFYNICPHRGMRILQGPDGHSSHLTCPYHGWQFDRAGVVDGVFDPEDYPQGNPCGRLRLQEIRCEQLFGMVWFNMEGTAPDLSLWLGETVVREIGSYRIESMVRVLNMTAQADCNWKIITDNFNESYHVHVLHPELVPYIESDGRQCQFDMLANGHNRGWFPSFQPGRRYSTDTPAEPLVSLMAQWGLDAAQYAGRDALDRIRTDILAQKRKLGPARGYEHYEHLEDYQLTDYIIYNLFPNSVITVGPDGVQLLRPRPHATDPTRCEFDHWWMVPRIGDQQFTPSPAGGPDLPVEDAVLEVVVVGEKSLGRTADQDLSVAASQQRALRSAGFRPFYLTHQERRVQHFHETLDDFVGQS
jgi:phenylpropionate dioxygenase-like ring-hydroxylating dioxygenase large terminal subunit